MRSRFIWDVESFGLVTLPIAEAERKPPCGDARRPWNDPVDEGYQHEATIRRIQGYPHISKERRENAHTVVMPFGPEAGKEVFRGEARRGAYRLTLREARLFDPSVRPEDVCFGSVLHTNPRTGNLESYFVKLPPGEDIEKVIIQGTTQPGGKLMLHAQIRIDFKNPAELIPIKEDVDPSERVATRGLVFSSDATWAKGQYFDLKRGLVSGRFGRVRCVLSKPEAEREVLGEQYDIRQFELTSLSDRQKRKILEAFVSPRQAPGREIHRYHTLKRNCMVDAMYVLRTALEDDLSAPRRLMSKSLFRTTPGLNWILSLWGLKHEELPRIRQELSMRLSEQRDPSETGETGEIAETSD